MALTADHFITRVILVFCAVLIGLVLGTTSASADTYLPGTITEDMTWTAAGSPYIGSSVTIAAGATVTVEPGAVAKFRYVLYVDGGLDVRGSQSDPAVFTSQQDTAPGQWRGVEYRAGSSGAVDNAEFRFAGEYGTDMLSVRESIPISNSTFRSASGAGVSVRAGSGSITSSTFSDTLKGIHVEAPASPSVTSNTIQRSARQGITYSNASPFLAPGTIDVRNNTIEESGLDGFYLAASAGYGWADGGTVSGNAFVGNIGKALRFWGSSDAGNVPLPQDLNQNTAAANGCDCVALSTVDVAQPTTWRAGLPFVVERELEVADSLTMEGGVVVKGTNGHVSRIMVTTGNLDIRGSSGNRVTFTSFADDTHGGDTNHDGDATQPQPGDWSGVTVKAAGQATIEDARWLYGGAQTSGDPDYGTIKFEGPSDQAPSSLRNSTVAYSDDDGVWVPEHAGEMPTVEYNLFFDNYYYAIYKQAGRLLEAPHNDFGCDSGPGPQGCGDDVNLYVLAYPWSATSVANGQCPGGKSQCPKTNEPVVLSTGAFTHAHEDLRLTNKGLPLVLSRSYYSQDPADAGLGRGWSFDGLLSATTQEDGDVVIRRADGRRDTYTLSGETYTPPSGVHDILTKNADNTYNLTALDRTIYEFDATGRIDRITDDHGQGIDYAYDTNGRLSGMADSSGQSIAFTYDSSNHITKATDTAGRQIQYGYDANKRLTSVTDPLGGIARYTYDDEDRMTAIEDPNQTTFIQNTYDSVDRVTLQEDGLGNVWDIDYQDGSATVKEPEGGITTTTFDSLLRTQQETDQVGEVTTYSYDAQGNIDHIIRPGGADYAFTYDARGNLTQTTDPENDQRDFAYDERNRLTSFTDARQKTWDFIWDAQDDLATIRDPIGYETTFTYDQAGLPLTATDPLAHRTTYAYDARGNPTSVTDPLDHTTTHTYDQYDNLTSVTQPGKDPATYTRNALGDLLAATNPEGETTFFGYDGNGELTRITDPGTYAWQIERNAMERPQAIVDPLTRRTEIAYDGNLNPTSVTDRRGNTTTYAYDLANRLARLTRPEGGIYQLDYDVRGNLASLSDPRGNQTTYAYDLADRLTGLSEPEGTATSYAYDAEANLTRVTDPRGNVTSFGYDDLGFLTEIAQPLEKTTTFAYDEAQNLKSRTTAAGTLAYVYDEADRLKEVKEGDSTLRAFGYDAADRMTSATAEGGTTLAVAYDQADRPTSIDDGLGQTATLAHDVRGNLTSQQDARGATGYAFDELGRLGAVTDPQGQTTAFTYDEEGNLASATYPNGVISQKAHDRDGRITEINATKDAEAIDRTTYTYDQNANRVSMTDRSGSKTSYAYDRLNRLTQMSKPPFKITKFPLGKPLSGTPHSPSPQRPYSRLQIKPWVTAYAYDKAGNLTQKGSTTFQYNDLNELVSSSDGTTYAYDGAGRLTGKTKGSDSETYAYDLFEQLRSVTKQDQTKTFAYDALGRQAAWEMSGQTETTHYSDLADIATFETDQGGQVSRSYVSALPTASGSADLIDGLLRSTVSLPNQAAVDGALTLTGGGNPVAPQAGTIDPAGLIEERANGTSTHPLGDGHGDITAITGQGGALESRKTFDPWGTQTSGTADDFGYLGAYLRRTDPGTGLTQMGARQYDPAVSRFTSEDRVLGHSHLGQSWDRHSYVIDNPYRYRDLDGRSFLNDGLRPGANTGGKKVETTKWGTLPEGIKAAWQREPYASFAPSVRSFLGKDVSLYKCLRNFTGHRPEEEQGCLSRTRFAKAMTKVGRVVDDLAHDPTNWLFWPPKK